MVPAGTGKGGRNDEVHPLLQSLRKTHCALRAQAKLSERNVRIKRLGGRTLVAQNPA